MAIAVGAGPDLQREREGASLVDSPTIRLPGEVSSDPVPDQWHAALSGVRTDRSHGRRDPAMSNETRPRCGLAEPVAVLEMLEPCQGPKLSGQQLETVTWAQARFLASGLVPPRARLEFHDNTSMCRLRRGLYNPNTHTVEICNLNRETLIHELAHAWVHENLTETDRAEFARQRGLEVWSDHSVPWAERATEHAAEIIAWGIEEESRLVTWVAPDGSRTLRLLTIPNSTPAELAVSYQALTGLPAHPDRSVGPQIPHLNFSPEARHFQPTAP